MSKSKVTLKSLAIVVIALTLITCIGQYWIVDMIYLINNPTDQLYTAVLRRDADRVAKLVANGHNVNVIVNDSTNPLFRSLMSEDWAIAKMLLDNGASLDVEAHWQSLSNPFRTMIAHLQDVSREPDNPFNARAKNALNWLDRNGYLSNHQSN